MEVMRIDLKPAARTAVVISALVIAAVAQGFYFWAASLMFWLGPGESPTREHGLLIAGVTSVLLLVVAVVTALLPRAVLLGVVIGMWALLLLIYFPLWGVVGIPGLILVIVLGLVWIARSRRPSASPI